MRQFIKRKARTILGSGPVSAVKIRSLPKDALVIFSLHRIEHQPDPLSSAIPAAAFSEFVSWADRSFNLTTFAELQSAKQQDKAPAILSFDDGYACYKSVVEPILEKFGVPANLNIIPASVQTGLPPINVYMQEIIAQGGEADRAAVNQKMFGGELTTNDAAEFMLLASRALKYRPFAEQQKFWPFLISLGEQIHDFSPVEMLNLEDLRLLKRTELGAHSFEHASMESQSDTYLSSDFEKCQNWFNDTLGQQTSVYAFPNGSASISAAQRALDSGFSHALLVGEQFSQKTAGIHHRINMHGSTVQDLRSCVTLAKQTEIVA